MKRLAILVVMAVCGLVLSSCGKTATAILFEPSEVSIKLSDGAPAATVKVRISLNGDIPNGKTSYTLECNEYDQTIIDVDPHYTDGYWILVTGLKAGRTAIHCYMTGHSEISGILKITVEN